MLYDNALIVRAYLHAWQVTKEPAFKRIVEETLDFVARELTHEQGGFYSSLDADSEGEEGKFYVWALAEIRAVLKDDSDFFEAAYGISALEIGKAGQFFNAHWMTSPSPARFGLNPEAVPAKLADSHARLLTARASRIRPATDDKIITAWNGHMLAAFADAARTLTLESGSLSPNPEHQAVRLQSQYYDVATRNAELLLSELRPKLCRAWRNGQTTNVVFLEDYAALIVGLLE